VFVFMCVRVFACVPQETMHKCPLDRKGKHLLVTSHGKPDLSAVVRSNVL